MTLPATVFRRVRSGTGVWTGSAIATLFEMPRGKSAIAIVLGNITACALMMAAARGVIALPFFK